MGVVRHTVFIVIYVTQVGSDIVNVDIITKQTAIKRDPN